MGTARYVYWQNDRYWLGYFDEYPDYVTQGESLQDLEDNLADFYRELTSGVILGVRRVADALSSRRCRPAIPAAN